MKKFLLSLIAIITAFIIIPNVSAIEKPKVTDHEKVTIYIFRGNGCGHCSNAINYFYSLGDEYEDYFEVITYETWYNDNNDDLAHEVADALGHDLEGVPFIVVGEKYIGGFGETSGEKLVKYALEYYEDDKYKDIVKETLKDIEYEVEETTLEEAIIEENGGTGSDGSIDSDNGNSNAYGNEQSTSSEGGKYDTVIIIGIFVVLIGGCVGLVVLGRK